MRLIALAQEKIMDERDFLEATKTLDNVTDAVWKCAQRMQSERVHIAFCQVADRAILQRLRKAKALK